MPDREDYMEPACALCGEPGGEGIPRDRVLEKLRAYEDRNDWPGAERHLKYWVEEARSQGDDRGLLMLNNELMGYYRKQGKETEAMAHCAAALALIEKLGMGETVTAGTTWVNAGTVHEAFGDPEGALPLFIRARENYEKNLPPEDGRLGGLYNNMGLCLSASGRFPEAEDLFRRALAVMEKQENGQLEQAITWLNMADAVSASLPPEEAEPLIGEDLERAESLLNAESLPRDGYYAFVCEKCAPVFGYYGWFMTEKELEGRAAEIRARRG